LKHENIFIFIFRFQYMIHDLLHKFNLHLETVEDLLLRERMTERLERKIERLQNKNRRYRKYIAILKDIAIGIKRDDLKLIHGSCLRVRKFIEDFTAARNIFCV